jgi:hypothetical protein
MDDLLVFEIWHIPHVGRFRLRFRKARAARFSATILVRWGIPHGS